MMTRQCRASRNLSIHRYRHLRIWHRHLMDEAKAKKLERSVQKTLNKRIFEEEVAEDIIISPSPLSDDAYAKEKNNFLE